MKRFTHQQLVSCNFLYVLLFWGVPALAQLPVSDFRDQLNGKLIFQRGYVDQPYVVVLDDGSWLCVFTTNAGKEGSGGQYIVSIVSHDQGQSWSDTVRIENPTRESASWAMPYKTTNGWGYVFYAYNGDKIHQLNTQNNL